MYDVIVLGGGPAGVTAALRARELGASVALVERDVLGGTCTNDGCVPTRVLAKAARLVRDAEQYPEYGLIGERPMVDFPRLLGRVQAIIQKVHDKKRLAENLQASGVELFAGVGPAQFQDSHTLAFGEGEQAQTIQGEKIIICVGGHARRLPFPGSEHALTHSDIWQLPRLPRSVIVVGGAATGAQLASVFSAFGSRVWLLDVAPRLLAGEDEAVSKAMTAQFTARGIAVITGTDGIQRIERGGAGLVPTLRAVYTKDDEEHTLEVEAVVLAVGWPGNVESLNPGAAGIETEKSYIKVDDQLQTSVPHIFAAGDITGRMMLVQSGSYEARIAAENAVLGPERSYEHRIVPHGGFTDPEYASVGLPEGEAREQQPTAVVTVPYSDLDRAIIDGYPEGFFKLVINSDTRQVIGAHAVGEQAVEVIQLVAAAMKARATIEQLAELELAYPTYTAIVGLAARWLMRALGDTPIQPEWRSLLSPKGAEWEQS